jgi:hypothetical protein
MRALTHRCLGVALVNSLKIRDLQENFKILTEDLLGTLFANWRVQMHHR